jgi:alcohol dehydrogenase class IV
MRFEFATAARIIFGSGTLDEIGPLAAGMGSRALVVTGRRAERAAPLLDRLATADITAIPFAVEKEPTIDIAQAGTGRARAERCDLVIGFGGGSALDTGKAIAALLTNPGEPLDYLEVIGRGQPLTVAPAPYIAIPTTAGTGAEVTRNAVLASPEYRVKVSLRSPLMLPRVALVDPALTASMPPDITATTGLDALTQVIEPYVSNQANPLTDALCREGIQRAARALRRAYADGGDTAAREDMALASLFGGLALANAKRGAVHGFAGPFGGMFPDAPHGAVCAALLPHVMAANVAALRARTPDNPVLRRFDKVAQMLTGEPSATAADGVAWIQALCRDLDIAPLSAFGYSSEHADSLIEKAGRSSSMKGNPVPLTPDDMRTILHEAQ